ncbi:hypothetical protein FSARC_9759 [Fusarium sarcochroum]|uniref:Uncharacterized protein n=1 Tax=Fusarium sarcochroum TaxID=1208366 RepID=A0A8H4TQM8_9HYPO|nr:hypothetical protein FSARC_9759 [Fusarium sarcochroum]
MGSFILIISSHLKHSILLLYRALKHSLNWPLVFKVARPSSQALTNETLPRPGRLGPDLFESRIFNTTSKLKVQPYNKKYNVKYTSDNTYNPAMGNNLSSTIVPDTSGVVLSPEDRNSAIHLAVFWGASLYVCAMIFSTCALVDRWKGPYDRVRTTLGSVFAAILLSTAWPVVMAYLFMSPNVIE